MGSLQKTVFLFAGQGCHFPRMCAELFAESPPFRETLFEADRILGRVSGHSLIEHLFGHDDSWVMDILVSHPAIFSVQWALFEALVAKGFQPDLCVGASLGEYVAVSASQSVSFPEMLRLVQTQATVIHQQLPVGGMMTVLASCQLLDDKPELFQECTLAAENFPGHIVISGSKKALNTCQKKLEKQAISAFPLSVPYAFHSPDVLHAKGRFLENIQKVSFARPKTLLYSCCQNNEVHQPNAEYLWQVIEKPIGFSMTISNLEAELNMPRYVDCSPSGTLANFLKYLLGSEAHHRILTLKNLDVTSNTI